jgi:hypothetical protein
MFVRPFDGEELEGAELGEKEDETCVEMAAEAGRLTVLFPVIVGRGLRQILHQGIEVRAWDVLGKVLFVKESFGASNVRKKTSNGITIDPDGGLFTADDIGKIEPIGFEERFAEKRAWDFETDKLRIVRRGEAVFAELVDVEGEFGLDVSVRGLSVVDDRAVLFPKLGKLNRNGVVDDVTVPDIITDVMGDGADGEGEFVGGLCIIK